MTHNRVNRNGAIDMREADATAAQVFANDTSTQPVNHGRRVDEIE